jgi:hypothetical protein
MMKLETLKAGISLVGIEPTLIATVIAVVPIGDGAVEVLYKTPEGTIKERLLGRADEASISVATVERPWSFDGDGDAFKLAVEAKRIEVAGRRIAHVDKTLAAVHERLTKEIAFWSDRWMKLKADQAAGKDIRLNLDNIQRTINDLEGRLEIAC